MDETAYESVDGADRAPFRFSPRDNLAHEIEWRHWGPAAFREAKERGKLVLLSISAVWCHWCHVMDETTYSDPGVIERLNRDFIPVRVDSDKRPDINSRYNQGGWPTTTFLTATGRAVVGLTYAPPARLRELLDRMSALYSGRRQEIDVEATRDAVAELASLERMERTGMPGGEVVDGVEKAILERWDRTYGGMGADQKFPPLPALWFALSRLAEGADSQMRSFTVSTLDGMLDGELYDPVEGGFFRYATARDWSTPHYEKMLSDNAELVGLYCAASVILDNRRYERTARGALDYVLARLLDDEQRGFYGSQDADEHYFGLDAAGRSSKVPPAVDRTIYTDWNAKMLSSLVLASAVLADRQLLEIAKRSADFVWGRGFRPGRGLPHYFEGEDAAPRVWDLPGDQVFFLQALCDIYQATGEPEYLQRARELADLLPGRYVMAGGWIGEASGAVSSRSGPLSEVPADRPDILINARGAMALLVMDSLSPERGYAESAHRILGSLAEGWSSYMYFAGTYAMAVEFAEKGAVEVRLSDGLSREERRAMTEGALAAFCHRKVIRPERIDDYLPLEDGEEPPPTVVCSENVCLPVPSPGEVGEAILRAASAGDKLLKAAG